MTGDDVYGSEMDAPDEFDDATAERFLAGAGREVDPRLADALHDMRVAYSSPPAVGAELSAFMTSPRAASTRPASPRRFARMRSSIIAKIGVASAAVVAATGGLAAANALPAPIQNAASHVGIASGHHHDAPFVEIDDSTTTTGVFSMPVDVSPTSTTEAADNHGREVSDVAHGDTSGCEHGAAVSSVASEDHSHAHTPEATDTTDVTDSPSHDGEQCDNPNSGTIVTPSAGTDDQPDATSSGDQQHRDQSDGAEPSDAPTTTAGVSGDGSGDHGSGGGGDTSSGGDSHVGSSTDGSGSSGSDG